MLTELFQEGFHLGLLGHFHGVAGNEKLIGQVAKGEFDKGFILARAKEYADGRLVAGGHFVLFIIGDIGVELAEVLVAERLGFQFHKDMALEHAVIEDKINEEMFVANEDAFLPGLKAEAVEPSTGKGTAGSLFLMRRNGHMKKGESFSGSDCQTMRPI